MEYKWKDIQTTEIDIVACVESINRNGGKSYWSITGQTVQISGTDIGWTGWNEWTRWNR